MIFERSKRSLISIQIQADQNGQFLGMYTSTLTVFVDKTESRCLLDLDALSVTPQWLRE